MTSKIIIIGAGAAGVSAAASARKQDRTAEITIITEEEYAAYSRCGMPFVLSGEIPSFQDLILYPPDFYRMMKLDLLLETRALDIDIEKKSVKIQKKNGEIVSLTYDALIMATGARASKPPIKGIDKKGVHLVRTISDCQAIDSQIKKSKSAIIIGAGLIGLEVAAAIKERGLKCTVIEFFPQVLPQMLDPDMAKLVQENLIKNSIDVMVGKTADAIIGDDTVKSVSVSGTELSTDMVILATGVRPEVELLKKIGAEIGITRSAKVDIRMRTNLDEVYAVGDCAETSHIVSGRPVSPQLGTTAVRQGRVAGINAAGGYSTLPSVLGSAITRFLGQEIGQTGLTENRAKEYGLKPIIGTITAKTRAHYYPGGTDIKIKLIAEPELGRIIGTQIIGGEEVTQRINMASIAIQKGLTVHEVNSTDTCYSPPVSDYWEPFITAAEMALRKI
ncbi:FAD-dependent oxidoreductase [[Eubacterium] cellulosolvens]